MVHRSSGLCYSSRVKRAIIFDFDGTIADSLPAVVQVFEELTKHPERFSPEQIDSFRDLSVPELLHALNVPKWKVPRLLIKGRQMIHTHLHDIKVHHGMADVLKSLHEQGIPLYILSSNSTENLKDYVRWHKLDKYFTAVYGGASVFGKAPKLLKLIEEQGIDSTQTWYVGDEMRDVSAARAIGLHIASVAWGYNTRAALERKKPDVIADTAPQLLKELEKAWKK